MSIILYLILPLFKGYQVPPCFMFYLQQTFVFITCSSPWYLQLLIKTRNKQLPGFCLLLFNNREQQSSVMWGFIFTYWSSPRPDTVQQLALADPAKQQLWEGFAAVLRPLGPHADITAPLLGSPSNGKVVSLYLLSEKRKGSHGSIRRAESCWKAPTSQLPRQKGTRPVTKKSLPFISEKNTIALEMWCVQFFLTLFKNEITVFWVPRRMFMASFIFFYH